MPRRRNIGLDRYYLSITRNRDLLRRVVGIVEQQERQLYWLTSTLNATPEYTLFGQIPLTQRQYTTCPISHTVFQDHTAIRVLDCGHYFTRNGIDEWFERSSSCPLCRGDGAPAPEPSDTIIGFVVQGPEEPESPRAPPTGEGDISA